MSGTAELDGGSLVERLALKSIVEACLILEEGISSTREIDLGMVQGAKSLPPFAAADQMGLDVLLGRLELAEQEWGAAFAPPRILRRLVAQGRLGPAAGQGFFPHPRPDEAFADGPVKLETRGHHAIAWLDNPPANSISPDTVASLRRTWEHVAAASSTVRVLVFASANPQLFCAGADIKAFTKMDAEGGRRLVDEMHGLLREMEQSDVVTIAAVNGLALGGGCELAMGCDFRIAADSASFGQPEISLGIIPGFGGTQRLPRLVGTSKALEMNLTGDPISAQEAYELGLANRLVPDHELLDTSLAWAHKLAGRAPRAVEQIKRISGHEDLDAGIEAEKRAFAEVFASADAREGISAFLQKRKPKFTRA